MAPLVAALVLSSENKPKFCRRLHVIPNLLDYDCVSNRIEKNDKELARSESVYLALQFIHSFCSSILICWLYRMLLTNRLNSRFDFIKLFKCVI